MKLVIDLPENLRPALVELAHSIGKPAEQYVEDYLTEGVRQRLYHWRPNGQTNGHQGACGFEPNTARGDRPALTTDVFDQAQPPKRRCPDCNAIKQAGQDARHLVEKLGQRPR